MWRSTSLTITPEMLNLIAAIDEFKGAWRALGTIAPERLRALRQIATIESIGASTRIEGGTLTDQQVEHLLTQVDLALVTGRDEQEVAGYAAVMELILTSWESIPITPNGIRQLHKIMLEPSDKDAWHRGEFKRTENAIVAFDADGTARGIVLQTASPFDTPRRMEELTRWFADEEGIRALHPLLRVGMFVAVFLEVHPFQDGNGRLSRVLTTLMLLQAGYAYIPYGSLEHIIEQRKDRYYLALRRTQATLHAETANWEPWLIFFLQVMRDHVRRLETRVERERILLTTLSTASETILQHARAHGRVTIGEMVTLTGTNRNTLKGQFRMLVQRGLLIPHGAGRSTWYSAS